MKIERLWADHLPDQKILTNDVKSVVYDIVFSADGHQLIAAVGRLVLVYDSVTGETIKTLKAHTDAVYALSYSSRSKCASGGADRTVILWNSRFDPILKYNHYSSIQCIAFNPAFPVLVSCTAIDFGLWSQEQRNVQKYKISSKALCCSWVSTGEFFSIGMINGCVNLYDRTGQQKVVITRDAPIWCMAWNPYRPDTPDLLAVGCWDRTLSFYEVSGKQYQTDISLPLNPCSVSFLSDDKVDYLVIGGSDCKTSLWTKDGIFLSTISSNDSCVWCSKSRPNHRWIAVGCDDGTLSMLHISFSTVHGLYQDRYAFRSSLTDITVQNLITNKKVRIITRDFVKKIAIFRGKLAVQLPDRVLIYDVKQDPLTKVDKYLPRAKILQKMACNLLVVTSLHIILCHEKKLQLFSFYGVKIREWVMESIIRYIKVVCGSIGRESLLVGLKNGAVFKIFVDNTFPILIFRHSDSIRCLDLSASKKKLAIVDETCRISIYNTNTKEIEFVGNNATSVAWNTDFEDMLCYSTHGQLSIRTGNFPLNTQKMSGFVVGFSGSKIFRLQLLSMHTIDVPQSDSLHRYLGINDYENAFKVACLGVTDNDWRALALRALYALRLDIAKKCFIRLRDIRYIDLVSRIEFARASHAANDDNFRAEILAYQEKYGDASKLYEKANNLRAAIEMFLALRDWNRAKVLIERLQKSQDPNVVDFSMIDLVENQATWLEEQGDFNTAIEMRWSAKNYVKAINLIGERGLVDEMMTKCRLLNKLERSALKLAASYFLKYNKHDYASEILQKLEDWKSLLDLALSLQKWDEAFEISKYHPEYEGCVFLPYAEWLASNDRFDEAQDALRIAGKPDLALKMLKQLSVSAIDAHRFRDASYYYWLIASEHLKSTTKNADSLFTENYRLSELYFVYSFITRYIEDPFCSVKSETIFHTSQCSINRIAELETENRSINENSAECSSYGAPFGISQVYSLLALAKQSIELGAYKMARRAYDRLLSLNLPHSAWRNEAEYNSLIVRAKPHEDKEELRPVCFRCSTTNPLLNPFGDTCVACKHRFFRSFLSFGTLPLVEFYLNEGISHEKALKLLVIRPPKELKELEELTRQKMKEKFETVQDDPDDLTSENVQSLRFDVNQDFEEEIQDAFESQLMNPEQNAKGVFPPIFVDEASLINMAREHVFIIEWPNTNISPRYFRSIIPEIPINLCSTCNHFFLEEEFESYVLLKKACPFCRISISF